MRRVSIVKKKKNDNMKKMTKRMDMTKNLMKMRMKSAIHVIQQRAVMLARLQSGHQRPVMLALGGKEVPVLDAHALPLLLSKNLRTQLNLPLNVRWMI